MRHKNLILTGIVLIFCALNVAAQDWPDWRGANRDGVWNETGVVEKFSVDSLPAVWSVPVGAGYSGPTVANGKVYLTDRLEKPEPTEGVLCFDEQTGKKIWEHRYNCEYEGVGYPAGPRASVVINNGKAYALGTMGNLFCFDAENGNIVWQRDLNRDYKIRMPIWGIAATPLIADDKIILQISGSDNACVVALDKNTGKETWRNLDDMASYSAPVLITQANKKVVVVWTEDSLTGLDRSTGKVYWRIPWKIKMGMGISTPVLYQNYIFVSCFYSGSLLVKLGENSLTAEKVWQRQGQSERKTDALHCVINTPVILDDYIYGVDSYGELRCLELKTGDRVWENLTAVPKNRWANIHFIQHGDKTWMFNEKGELIISKLDPQGFHEMSRTKIIEPTQKQLPRGVTWSHPAFANRHVFARNDNRLICVDVSKQQ